MRFLIRAISLDLDDTLFAHRSAVSRGIVAHIVVPAGAVLAEIAVPAQCPTMPCFGGDDLKTLYLTTARDGRPAQELQDWPDSGCVFSMRVEVAGLPVNFYQD